MSEKSKTRFQVKKELTASDLRAFAKQMTDVADEVDSGDLDAVRRYFGHEDDNGYSKHEMSLAIFLQRQALLEEMAEKVMIGEPAEPPMEMP